MKLRAALALTSWAVLSCSTPGPRQPPSNHNTHQAGADGAVAERRPDESTRDKLRELAHKVVAAPDDHAGFSFSYLRGHALAGTTRFSMSAAGTYTLESNVTEGRRPVALAGALAPAERDAVLGLIIEHDVLATAPSTRNIGDDEEPVIIEVRAGDLAHELRLWHGDAMQDPRFHAFEVALVELLGRLSGGAILNTVTY